MIIRHMSDSSVRGHRDKQKPSGLDLRNPFIEGAVIVLIAAAALYLITNHWLHILDALPYVWVAFMMGMHLFMHGGHGGHGGHGRPSAGPREGADHVQ
jgi:hypothetical protein